MNIYYVYIMANENLTLYIGVTNDLVRRASEHKEGSIDGFTKRYGLKNLVYYESTGSIEEAIVREKILKHWKREWKLNLIVKDNPNFKDLYKEII